MLHDASSEGDLLTNVFGALGAGKMERGLSCSFEYTTNILLFPSWWSKFLGKNGEEKVTLQFISYTSKENKDYNMRKYSHLPKEYLDH